MYANAQRWVFRAALNDSNESLEVTETGNAFQTVAAACTKVQSPATVRDLFATDVKKYLCLRWCITSFYIQVVFVFAW